MKIQKNLFTQTYKLAKNPYSLRRIAKSQKILF